MDLSKIPGDKSDASSGISERRGSSRATLAHSFAHSYASGIARSPASTSFEHGTFAPRLVARCDHRSGTRPASARALNPCAALRRAANSDPTAILSPDPLACQPRFRLRRTMRPAAPRANTPHCSRATCRLVARRTRLAPISRTVGSRSFGVPDAAPRATAPSGPGVSGSGCASEPDAAAGGIPHREDISCSFSQPESIRSTGSQRECWNETWCD